MTKQNFYSFIVIFAFTLTIPIAAFGRDNALRGFTAEESVVEREWEKTFRTLPNTDNLRDYMRVITEEPHIAGLPNSKKVADYILGLYKSWGLNAWIEETQALMPLPTERFVALLEPEKYILRLEEPALIQDKDSADTGQLPTYNAYASAGNVVGQIVYVNYGTPEDYETLEKLGISVNGKIVLARYGRSWRGIKVKLAQTHGAIACLIYSDPFDDGYYQGLAYPNGPYRPDFGVQRGSVMDMPIHPGDPLSPGFGAKTEKKRLTLSEAKTLMKIPSLPISHSDALPLLRNLRGTQAPTEWRGALPITYYIGPGPAKVHVKLEIEWKTRPLYNVLAKIDGTLYPDEWLIYGNHHDAWGNGASDPTSGNVALIETARSLSTLVEMGWQPKRTILFASWDGEEWGLLGSTEWAETHKEELIEKGVVYINTDSTGKGWLSMAGSHTLQRLINDVARDIDDPQRGVSIWQAARSRSIEQAGSDKARDAIEQSDDLRIAALGSGSDYTVFLDHLTMASLNLSFRGDSDGGVYHSNYDSFDWYRRFSDGDFIFGRALSQTVGTALMRLANSSILPFNFVDLSDTMKHYVDEIRQTHATLEDAPSLDFASIDLALNNLSRAGTDYEMALNQLSGVDASALAAQPELAQLNKLLYQSERSLGHDEGLPNREWFRHQVYAPGFYTGYGVKTIPGLREGIEEEAWDEARYYIKVITNAIGNVVQGVDEAKTLLINLTDN